MKVKFHLPDFARLGKFNLMFKIMLERSPEFFREGVEIASVYGTFPPSAWNGGRLQPGNCNLDFVKNVVRIYENNNIPLRFTFTNPMVEEEHLSDEFCNYVLETAHNENNGCIVFSPVLEEYIRKNFPKYKITSSTCKRILDADTLYNELEKDYHLVVLDYDLNHRYDILEKIPNKEKIEILVNPCCTPACPNRSLHYKMLGMEQLIIANHVKKYPQIPYNAKKFETDHPEGKPVFECQCENRTVFDIQGLSTHITPDEIWDKYVPMGFNNFKIEGRTFDLFNLIEHYMYYMVKPECRDKARRIILRNLMRNDVISCDY